MTTTLTLSLRPDAVATREGDEVVVRAANPPAVVRLKQASEGLHGVFDRLGNGGATEDDLQSAVLDSDGPAGLFKLTVYLKRLHGAALLCRTIRIDGVPFASLEPMSLRFAWSAAAESDAPFRLSRFACCRREGDGLLLESPMAPARVLLHDARAALAVGVLAASQTHESLTDALPGVPLDSVRALVAMLSSAGALEPAAGQNPDEARALAQWEFQDLLLHTRARMGRHNGAYGGHFPFVGTIDPLPAIKPPMSPERIALHVPDLNALAERDMPLTRAIETRRSDREFSTEPLTTEQLGEFLYRVGRVKQVTSGKFGEFVQKPFPSGGGLYELEIYPVVERCAGLEPGLYHYAAGDHQLERIRALTPEVEGLLDDAWAASERHARPQVLLVVAARFQRVQWKYRSVSYALVLKHVGVLYQTMYLVATAMGLGACALGGGDADKFAEATGLNYFEESSVGEFMLGARA